MSIYISDDKKKIELADFIIEAANRVERGYLPGGESQQEMLKDFAKLVSYKPYLSPYDIAVKMGRDVENEYFEKEEVAFLSFDYLEALFDKQDARLIRGMLGNILFNAGLTWEMVDKKVAQMERGESND
jgi:hypothetical protein